MEHPPSPRESDSLPTYRCADSLRQELLRADTAPLRARIANAGDDPDHIRALIHAQAERRPWRLPSGLEAQMRLMGWPVLLNTESLVHMSGESSVQGPIAQRVASLWSRALANSGASEVFPLPYAINLMEAIGLTPTRVHEVLFRFGCHLQGQDVSPARLTAAHGGVQLRNPVYGPLAVAYLVLAAVVYPNGSPELTGRIDEALRRDAQALLSGALQESEQPVRCKLGQPQGFFEALEQAQLEHLSHFAEWCELRRRPYSLSMCDQSEEGSKDMKITMSCELNGQPLAFEVAFDGYFRFDSLRRVLIDDARRRGRIAAMQGRRSRAIGLSGSAQH